MRILVLNWQDRTNPQAGGAETHLHEMFGRIAAAGHSVTLFCSHYDDAPLRETLDGIDVIRAGGRSTFNYTVPRWYRRHVDSLAPDIVIDDINKIPFFTPLYVRRPLLALIHHFFGPAIFQQAGLAAGAYVKFFEDRIGRIYRETPINVVSESTRKECIERGLDGTRISVIHNAIDQHAFPMTVGIKSIRPTVVYFGRLKKYKSVDHLLLAAAMVKRDIPDLCVNIMGTGDDRPRLEDLCHELGIADNVTFTGFVTDEEKVRRLSEAHVAVNTSVKEGWGITNIEANACGTPVISADVPGLRDSIRDGESGKLYQYGDIDSLARTIKHVLVNDEERRRLSEGAVRWASTFTWERSAREMIELCTRTIASYR